MGCFVSTMLFLVCVASAFAAGWLFLNSKHVNIASTLAFASMAACAKMVQKIEGDSPYQRGLTSANEVFARNRRTR